MDIVSYLIVGVFAGLSSGLLGIGGGVIVVPALLFIFNRYVPVIPSDTAMHVAVGCSLAAMIFTTFSSSLAHYRRGSINWQVWRCWIIGLLCGGVLGAVLADVMPTLWLSKFFGAFLLIAAIKLFFGKKRREHKPFPGLLAMNFIGVGFGLLSGLLGVGGGILMVPFLLRYGLSMAEIAGTSTAASFFIAIIATMSFIVVGWHESQGVLWATGYIYWPAVMFIVPTSMLFAPVGAKLSHVLPGGLIKQIFSVFLVLVAVKMFI